MSAGSEFRLVPLDCPSCGAPVRAQGADVVFYCTACRNGYRYDAETEGLEPVEVAFVAAPQVAAERYLPFWLLPAKVKIRERQAAGAGLSGLMSLFLGGEEEPRSAGDGVFAVPAFHLALEPLTRLVRQYTQGFAELEERLGERLLGGCYGPEDARKLAHYAVIASEVGRPDLLKSLRYKIRFGEPRLLGVPFVTREGTLQDGLFGIEVTGHQLDLR
jgi:hypothetical protein